MVPRLQGWNVLPCAHQRRLSIPVSGYWQIGLREILDSLAGA
jgi:hypothetical protein